MIISKILCKVDIEFKTEQKYIHQKWAFKKANWEKYIEICDGMVNQVPELDQTVGEMNNSISTFSIPISQSKKNQTNVPWWNDKCKDTIKDRNRAFKNLCRTLTTDNLIDYQKKKAIARRVIKEATR